MYCEVTAKWKEVKNCETFINKWSKGELEVERVLTDYDTRKIYVAVEIIRTDENLKEFNDEDYVTYMVRESYGPYGTEASLKTARSKITNKLRSRK